MPENGNVKFGEPVRLLHAVGKLTDQYENVFQVAVTGPEDQVGAYVAKPTLNLEIWSAEEAEERQRDVSQDKPQLEEKAVQEGEREEPPEPTEEELAQSLFINIGLAALETKPPYVLHFEEDPELPISESPRYYGFTDSAEADVMCVSNSGNADLYLYEQECGSGYCWWNLRCSSTNLAPVDQCRSSKLYTGTWLVRVEAVTDCNFTLTGDLYVT